jgi:hypothetical protein
MFDRTKNRNVSWWLKRAKSGVPCISILDIFGGN